MAPKKIIAYAQMQDDLYVQKPLEQLCCVSDECAMRGQVAGGNLSVKIGKGSGRWRILYCSCCKSEFSETKGTALWGSRMPLGMAKTVAQHLQEGCGIRQTARLTGASKDGVTAMAIRLGLHAKRFHDQHVQGVAVPEVQLDERWSFVKKKRKALRPAEPGRLR